MEIKDKNRKNIKNIKNQASSYANEARFYAKKLKESQKTFTEIDTLEKRIHKAELAPRTARNFCTKEVDELRAIHSNLKERFTKRIGNLEKKYCTVVIVAKFFFFLDNFIHSIPQDYYKGNITFYVFLGIITELSLIWIFIFYFKFYKFLFINFITPLLEKYKSTSETANKRLYISTYIWFSSLLKLIYICTIIAIAQTTPRVFLPSMSIFALIGNIWNAFVQVGTSSPMAAIGTAITIISFICSIYSLIYSWRKNHHK